jgi:hypothetical protein
LNFTERTTKMQFPNKHLKSIKFDHWSLMKNLIENS